MFEIVSLLFQTQNLSLEQALNEHLNIPLQDTAIKEQTKHSYVTKCVRDIKKVCM